MVGSRYTIVLALGTLLAAAGCASSPWLADDKPLSADAARLSADAAGTGADQSASTKPAPAQAEAAAGGDSGEAMLQVMAEVEQMGVLDPAAQQKLLADLKQTDPALWPLLVRQFQAALEYRQRSQQPAAGQLAIGQPNAAPIAAAGQPTEPIAQTSLRPNDAASNPADQQFNRLPIASNTALPPTAAPAGGYPNTSAPGQPGSVAERSAPTSENPPAENRTAENRTAEKIKAKLAGPVVAASYPAPTKDPATKAPATAKAPVSTKDWREHLAATISDLETRVGQSPQSDEETAQHARLRMLYLIANRREDAVRPIPGMAEPMQQFWSKELCGLAAGLDTKQMPELRHRAAEAKRHLVGATASLGESAPLTVCNLAFCRAVQSFGSFKEFKRYEFTPDQEVLLYAEVENFSSEETAKGFHTALRSSYQILDSQGRRVDGHEFAATTEDYCRGLRRDFFIGYNLRMPKRAYDGEHTLQLTIEDLKAKKIGQSSIKFTIKAPGSK